MWKLRWQHAMVFGACCLLAGCGTLGYYSQIIDGHFGLMESQQEIEEVLAEHKFTPQIRQKLARVLEIRQFASQSLGLPDNDSYKSFVKLKQKYPVWNVIAAEKFSVQAKQWCFLFVGCISYRGYFKKRDAEAKAEELMAEGYDVRVSPAAAYSTLGWFDDPLLSSMLYKDEAQLAGIIFHELAHQKIYIDDDSSFNEAFATAIELEGVRRWLEAQGDSQGIKRYRLYKQRQAEFNALLQASRHQLKFLYSTKQDVGLLLVEKQRLIAAMKTQYKSLKRQWGGYGAYDSWMQGEINNADLALVATYHEWVPAFVALLKQQGDDLELFYAEVSRLGDLSKEQRSALLAGLSGQQVVSHTIHSKGF